VKSSEGKHEVDWKSLFVALHCLVKHAGLDAINPGKIMRENYPFAADEVDLAL